MMIKKKSNPWARMKSLYVLPLAAVAVAAFARPEVSSKLDEISSVKVNDLTSIVKAEEVKSVENSSEEKFQVVGTVLEADTKMPVIAASVIIKGTNIGTLTDFDGKFTLSVKKGDVIQVSFIGYQPQSVVIKDKSPLDIRMKGDVQNLEEMTVVGNASNGVGAPAEDSEKKVVSAVGVPEAKKVLQQERPVFQVVEEMPQFPGGMQAAMNFLATNIKYPIAAQQAKIEGRVIVQFVVNKDGSVSDVGVLRSLNPELDAEAVRVVSLMPKWIPGKQRGKAVDVKYTMPIVFRLNTSAPQTETGGIQHVSLKVDEGASDESVRSVKNFLRKNADTASSLSYVVVVDGVEKGMGMKVLQKVPFQMVASINVLNTRNAVAKYGEKAKDGAIEIKTKKR